MAPATVTYRKQVLELIAKGKSYRKIATELGVHVRSVERIAYHHRQQQSDPVRRRPLLETIRCPGCRAKLKELPCLYCQLCRARNGK